VAVSRALESLAVARASLRRVAASTLARSSVAFIAGSFVQRAVPLLLLPILTRYLSLAEYGQVVMFTLAVNLLEPIAGLSSTGAISRQYFEREHIDFPNFVSNCLYLLGWTAGALALLLVLGAGAAGEALGLPSTWIWVAAAVAAGKYLINVLLTVWQVSGRPWPYALLSIFQSVVSLGLSVLLIAGFDWDWTGRAVGELVGVGASALVAWALLRREWTRPGYATAHVGLAARFGAGLLPHLYGGLLLASADRLFLAKLSTLEQVGLYAVAVQVSSVITVLASSFNLAWIPWTFERLKRNTVADRRQVARLIGVHDLLLLGAALGIALLARPALSLLVGEQFRDAAPFVLVLSLGAVAGGMYNMAVNPIFFSGRTYLVPIASLGSGSVNLLLNWLLIPPLGPMGAALAFALSSVVCFLIASVLAQRIAVPPIDAVPAHPHPLPT
jgi:O-antigen/teichoic acid export membrane protein